MIVHNFDPVFIDFGIIEIRWYSLAYIFGILFGWFYCKRFLIKDKVISTLFDDLLTYLIIGIIIGGRLGYILFYNLKYYLNNLLEIFFIWEGGMSFHGGLIGIFIATYVFSKKNKINKYIFLDLISISAPIGIFFGRIANFINVELYGRKTDFFIAMIYPSIDNIPRHPSQIYEAFFEGIILFIILYMFRGQSFTKEKYGYNTSLFLIFYGVFRFFLEFLREPDLQLGLYYNYFTMGQLLSIPMILIGLIIYLKK